LGLEPGQGGRQLPEEGGEVGEQGFPGPHAEDPLPFPVVQQVPHVHDLDGPIVPIGPRDVAEPVDLIVCDVSFISVTLILPVLPALLRSPGALVILIKPQFEAGREQVGKGGIVRDPEAQQFAVERVRRAAAELGAAGIEVTESPILGAEGNREFLLHCMFHL